MRVSAAPVAVALLMFLSGCRDRPAGGPVGTYGLGERAQAGALLYTVLDTQWAISLGEGPAARVPSSRFLLIKVSALNSSGRETCSVPSLTLVDDSGRAYQEITGSGSAHDWLGIVRAVRPGESIQGVVLFDVPQKRFKLRVADENDQKYAYVNIPFSLGEPLSDSVPAAAANQ